MDAETYRRCLNHARRVLPPDPMLDAEDLVQMAWIKAKPWLDGDRPVEEQRAYLMTTINTLAIDQRRRRACRPTVPLEDWHARSTRFEDDALDCVLLAPLVDEAQRCSAGRAVLLIGAGYTWREAAKIAGASTTNITRWRQAHAEA